MSLLREPVLMIEDSDKFLIEVVHVKKHPDSFPIHRGFPLGNPFVMKTEAGRDEVCELYEDYFRNKLASNDTRLTTELARAVEKTIQNGYIKLGCLCAPKRCHGDTIARFLNAVLNG